MPVEDQVAAALLGARFIADYPEQAARVIEEMPARESAEFLSLQTPGHLVRLWPFLDPQSADAVLPLMSERRGAELLAAIDPIDCAQMLNRQDDGQRERLLQWLAPGQRADVRRLMDYPPRTAGQLMSPRVTRVFEHDSAAHALTRVRRSPGARFRHVFVVDGEGLLLGLVDIQDLALAERRQLVGQLMSAPVAVASPFDPVDEVAEQLTTLRLEVLPVVDVGNRLLGALGHASLLRVLESDALADMRTMVGGSPEERSLSSAWFAVRKRLPWMHIILATAFLAAAVVGLFESTIAQFTALAVLLPVVAGQSGNAGAQAQAVTMRGLALREVTVRQWPRLLRKEIGVGAVNGLVIALVTGLGVMLWSGSYGLALVIGVAMVISMVAAGMSGVLIPILLTRLGQDPAQSSSIVLTTVTDVVGFLSFLGIASLLSGLL